MARARNIKPAFFANDELAEVRPLGRLLFIGLWTMADRAGRLEDRPKRIKAEVLPYDDCDAEELLSELAEREFIVRYAVGGRRYIQVVNFAKHQNPHVREPESEIPGPADADTGPDPGIPDRSDEHCASTVPGTSGRNADTGPAGRIPDSPSLIPPTGSQREEACASPHAPPPAAAEPPAKRGTRIPERFPTEEELEWCRQERADLNAEEVAAKFRDYWVAVPGAKARKLDWPATWRNFVRGERPGRPAPRSQAPPSRSDRAYETVLALTGQSQPEPETIDVLATHVFRASELR